jgi:serine/threonine-protein kinase
MEIHDDPRTPSGGSGQGASCPPGAFGRCGAFDVLFELASGGMATVFLGRAHDRRDGPLVAIKRPHRHLASDAAFLSMLVDEARLASAIDHPNVVRVRKLGFDGVEPFIVMDYVEGGSLSQVRQKLSELGKTLAPRLALRIAIDALAGLEAAHVLVGAEGRHLGIVHRDVSPHNVLVGCDGSARLTDFGIAKAADRVQVTRTHEVKGKLAYLAPERIDQRRICTAQSDVFSLSVVLWECISGRRLFRGAEALETLQEVVAAPIPSLIAQGCDVSKALDDVILRGLARDLETRFVTAAELSKALADAAGPGGVAERSEVAELVDALFDGDLRVRHVAVSAVLGVGVDISHVLALSGLSPRPDQDDARRARARACLEALPELQPELPRPPVPAPIANELLAPRAVRSGLPRGVVALLAVGALVAVGALGALGRGVAQRTLVADGRVEARTAPSGGRAVLEAARRVIVTLPFAASQVTVDGNAVDVPQATSAVVVDVPAGSARTHHIVAVAPDGARAEASVVEDDGVARPSGGGFVVETLETYAVGSGAASGASGAGSRGPSPRDPRRPGGSPSSIGTVKGGFTKIR